MEQNVNTYLTEKIVENLNSFGKDAVTQLVSGVVSCLESAQTLRNAITDVEFSETLLKTVFSGLIEDETLVNSLIKENLIVPDYKEFLSGDIITQLDFLKRRELQYEYFMSSHDKWPDENTKEKGKSLYEELLEGVKGPFPENLVEKCTNLLTQVEYAEKAIAGIFPISRKELDDLDGGGYNTYTADNHGKSFWNEIPLPSITDESFYVLSEIIGQIENQYFGEEFVAKNRGKYLLTVYDMSDRDIEFSTLKSLESFLDSVAVGPASVYELDGYYANGRPDYSELYSID